MCVIAPAAGLLTESFLIGLSTAKQGLSRCSPFTHTRAVILEPFMPISAGHAALRCPLHAPATHRDRQAEPFGAAAPASKPAWDQTQLSRTFLGAVFSEFTRCAACACTRARVIAALA